MNTSVIAISGLKIELSQPEKLGGERLKIGYKHCNV